MLKATLQSVTLYSMQCSTSILHSLHTSLLFFMSQATTWLMISHCKLLNLMETQNADL